MRGVVGDVLGVYIAIYNSHSILLIMMMPFSLFTKQN